eukprot:TRINITY_DN3611_c0_g1_i3.p1 TRINITY_DN3611_c0_g1~~TRINITY_DN3611_c0_g1_i3.p1  ORF type:complete len:611 (-),score=117.17 TRINITY_DN3611_c0_g1_i3:42-1874(-)
MKSLLDTLILTLFGNAFSPREEYLILELFRAVILNDVKKVKGIAWLMEEESSFLPLLVITYNKRKQGVEYLKNNFSKIVKGALKEEYNFETKPLAIYQKMINDEEVRTGTKSKLKRDVTADEASANKEVNSIITARCKDLKKVCQSFLNGIIKSLKDLPYGLRLICKQVYDIAKEKFPSAKPKEFYRVLGFLVFYRFVNLAIVTPDEYDMGSRDLSLNVRKNLVVVSKVLQKVFDLSKFKKNTELAPMNEWIDSTRDKITQYFNDLMNVPKAEDFLQINKYIELSQKTTPVILISYAEIVQTHKLLRLHASSLIEKDDPKDPLKQILDSLGDVPIAHEGDEKEVQLDLVNRFAERTADTITPENTYIQTVEMVVQLFRKLQIEQLKKDNLLDIFTDAAKTGDKSIKDSIEKIRKNLESLEKDKMVSKQENYSGFLKDVALEVANRAERREAQLKEIARLQATLKTLQKHGAFLDQQITEFESYLKSLRKTTFAKQKKDSGLKSKLRNKLFGEKVHKFTYKELAKRGVIISSEVPSISRGRTRFYITTPEPGTFEVEAKITGLSVAKMQIDIEDLLEKKDNNITELDLGQVTLDVNMTIHLIHSEILSGLV